MEERPDKWVVIKISSEDNPTIYRVLASWYGGYLDGDSWKMNSGIVKVEEDTHNYIFIGHSGSCYVCHKSSNCYGTSGYSGGILDSFIRDISKVSGEIEVMEEDTDWMNLLDK